MTHIVIHIIVNGRDDSDLILLQHGCIVHKRLFRGQPPILRKNINKPSIYSIIPCPRRQFALCLLHSQLCCLLMTSSRNELISTSLFSFTTEDSTKLIEDWPPKDLEVLEEVYITNLTEEKNLNT